MKTVTINTYKFSELTEEATQIAIDNYTPCLDYIVNDALATIKAGLKAFDCELIGYCIGATPDRGEYMQVSTYTEYSEDIQGFRLRTYLLNNFSRYLYTGKPQGKYEKRGEKWAYKRYSKVIFLETDCPFTGMCYDCDFLQPIVDFIKKPDSSTFKELMQSCVDNVVSVLHSEGEYRLSDEGKIEDIEANEWDFTENGETY